MRLASQRTVAERFISFVAAIGVGWFALGNAFAQAATPTPVPSATPTPSPILGKCVPYSGGLISFFYGCVAAGTVVGTNVPVLGRRGYVLG